MANLLDGFNTGSLLQLVSGGGEPDPTAGWSDQEKFLYQMHKDNLAAGGLGRPDQGGGTSTIYNTTVEIGGKHYVLPTIWKDETGVPIDVTPDQAIERAKKIGLDKFPSYDSEDEAEKRYQQMHDVMEKDMPDPAEDPSNILRRNFLRNMRGASK